MGKESVNFVLLHGWRGSSKSLEALSKELEKEGHKTLILEMPGHGNTPAMMEPWNMERFSKWANALIVQSGFINYVLVGHSFGGKIILEGVTNGILTPKKIVLIDSNGIKPRNSVKKALFKSGSTLLSPVLNTSLGKPIRKILYKYVIREADYEKTSGNLRESFKIFNEENYDEKLKKITIPTIIIWGTEDKVTPLWMGEKLNGGIRGSKLIKLKGTHGLPLKNPKVVALEIIKNL